MKELGVYIHIPFCKQKCYYCDFISFPNKDNIIKDYIRALKEEIKKSKDILLNSKIKTIYIGGGTPSYLESVYIKSILEEFNLKDAEEITIEVNPGTITQEKLIMYKEIGINRISIGLQSTNDALLKQIGRIHSYKDFEKTYYLIKKIGFSNINIDIIFGLPNQTINDIVQTIDKIVNLNPTHISTYSLILEEGTKLFYERDNYKFPSDELEREMYWTIKKELEKSGYIHYEISNFAKEGHNSKHNTLYWNQGEYIGFGLAAHSYLDNIRFSNISDIENYIKNIFDYNFEKNKIIQETQTQDDKLKEYIILKLRLLNGIDIKEANNLFNVDILNKFKKEIAKLVKNGLLLIDQNNIKLSRKGLDLANVVWEEFV